MSIVTPPATESATEDLSQSDWAIPCGYSAHEQFGTGPASWAVWKKPLPCGCPTQAFTYMCDDCWTWRSSGPLPVTCRHCCQSFSPPNINIIRVERI